MSDQDRRPIGQRVGDLERQLDYVLMMNVSLRGVVFAVVAEPTATEDRLVAIAEEYVKAVSVGSPDHAARVELFSGEIRRTLGEFLALRRLAAKSAPLAAISSTTRPD